MEAKEKQILSELIGGMKSQFVVPVYQRNYSWGEKECKTLFNDILELGLDTVHLRRKHFIGAFVYKFNKLVETQYNEFILIDGQQRLTSLTLLLKAFYDYLEQFGDKYQDTRNEIYESYLINKFVKESNLKMKLKPNKVDSSNFLYLMDNKFDEIDKASLIYRNYQCFLKLIKDMDCDVGAFYNAIQRVEGVGVNLEGEDDPQLIFESLNSKSMPLQDVDLIRNYLLMNCESQIQEKLYEKYWLKIESNFDDETFVNFIRDWLSSRNGYVVTTKEHGVYYAFKDFYSNGKYEVENFLVNLVNLAKIYSRLINKTDNDDPLSIALNDFIAIDMSTTFPFLFPILIDNEKDGSGKKKISDEEAAKIVRLIESYVIRRNICNAQGGGLSQVMASLYKNLTEKHKEKFYDDTYNKVAMYLAGITSKAYMPKDEEFGRNFGEIDMYKNRNCNYILMKLEKYLQGKEVVNFENLTIEHVIPQVLSPKWEKYLNTQNGSDAHESIKHRIGNLTLTAYNSEMSNKMYDEKIVNVEFSRLTLNQYFKKIPVWSSNEVIKRGDELLKLALKIWPFPLVKKVEYISSAENFLLDDEKIDYTSTSPSGIRIKEVSLVANSWSDIYLYALNILLKQNEELFTALLSKNGYCNNKESLLSSDPSVFRTPSKLSNGFYVETNNNTNKKIDILKHLFIDFGYQQDSVIIYLK